MKRFTKPQCDRQPSQCRLEWRQGHMMVNLLSKTGMRRVHLSLFVMLVAAIVWVGHASPVWSAEQQSRFVSHTYRDDDGEHRYMVYLPPRYNANTRWPVMLFLHGAGERGNDGKLPITVGLGPVIASSEQGYPFIVVFPQCEDTQGRILPAWRQDRPDARRALKILEEVERTYSVDTDREVLTGWSMGGYGVWSLAAADPSRWHAVVPLSGGGETEWGESLKSVPIWAFHGDDDTVVPTENSRKMIEAIEAAGGTPRYTEVTGIGHDVWKVAYAYPDLLKWMLNPSSVSTTPATLAAGDIRSFDTKSSIQLPFVPVLEIPNAIGVRLGNQALAAIAESVPKLVNPDTLTGKIDDINTSTTVQGRSFGIYFSEIGYTAALSRARVRAYRQDRLNIQLGLENIDLTIGSTYVDGAAREASAGPISIIIGHQRPVWLSFDVKPYVKDRRLRLQLVAQRFSIPEDNWYVTNPEGVWTRGWGMTRDRVSSGLVNGLYNRKEQIEDEVLSVIPTLIDELEQQLVFDDLSDLMDNVWPFPVYRPEVRLFPTDASCDERGVSVSFGIAAADVTNDETQKTVKVVNVDGPDAARLEQGEQLRFNLVPQALEPLTELLVNRQVAHIHVQDIPREPFAALSEYPQLVEVVPALSRVAADVQVRSMLTMTQPLRVGKGEGNETGLGINFEVPGLTWELSIKEPEQTDWQRVASCQFELTQTTTLTVEHPNHQHRLIKMAWSGEPRVRATGQYAEGFDPGNTELNVELLTNRFRDGWIQWTQAGPASESAVPDIDFGYARMRLEQIEWADRLLSVEFIAPKTRLSNASDVPLVYQVKGPYSSWGGPYTLAPGATHVFDGVTPLGYRSETAGVSQRFTLPAGSHLEFLVKNPGDPPKLYMARELSSQEKNETALK